jgi:hypothetical protein
MEKRRGKVSLQEQQDAEVRRLMQELTRVRRLCTRASDALESEPLHQRHPYKERNDLIAELRKAARYGRR